MKLQHQQIFTTRFITINYSTFIYHYQKGKYAGHLQGKESKTALVFVFRFPTGRGGRSRTPDQPFIIGITARPVTHLGHIRLSTYFSPDGV